MSMKVVDYLKRNGPEKLEEEYGIVVKCYDDRISLNYNQIESPKYYEIVKECRGLVLSLPDYRVLCRSFDRFYNYLEDPNHAEFDITKAICYKKLDGSLINIYHDGTEWQVATRKMAFAEGNTRLDNTYRSLVVKALDYPLDALFNELDIDKDWTYTFELVSPETRVVTRYSEVKLYMLNMRHSASGIDASQGLLASTAAKLQVEIPEVFTFSSVENIQESLKELPPLDEGYVCYIPEQQWRIKIKNPSYLAVAHLRGNNGIISLKRVIFLVCNKDYEEYLESFPEDRLLFNPYINAFNYMKGYVSALWHATSKINDRKEFAMAVKGLAQHLLFGIKDGKKLPNIIEKMTDNGREKLLQSFVNHIKNLSLLEESR